MNGNEDFQLLTDPLTGRPSFIHGTRVSVGARAAGTRLNQQRAGSIAAAIGPDASGQPVSSDGWAAIVSGRSANSETPLVSLELLGLQFDEERNLVSRFLRPLIPGAEAQPFVDEARGVVYKLFDLHDSGGLGKKIVIKFGSDFETNLRIPKQTSSKPSKAVSTT